MCMCVRVSSLQHSDESNNKTNLCLSFLFLFLSTFQNAKRNSSIWNFLWMYFAVQITLTYMFYHIFFCLNHKINTFVYQMVVYTDKQQPFNKQEHTYRFTFNSKLHNVWIEFENHFTVRDDCCRKWFPCKWIQIKTRQMLYTYRKYADSTLQGQVQYEVWLCV